MCLIFETHDYDTPGFELTVGFPVAGAREHILGSIRERRKTPDNDPSTTEASRLQCKLSARAAQEAALPGLFESIIDGSGRSRLCTGGVRTEHTVWRISWSALTLEAGKSPDEVPRADGTCRWHLVRRFPSSPRRRAPADPPTMRFSRQAPTRCAEARRARTTRSSVNILTTQVTWSIC